MKRVGLSVEVTRGQGDGGVDVIGLAREGGRPVFVQCKHAGKGTGAQIGEEAVRDLMRARAARRHAYPDPILVAATNGRFSLAAENLALELGVRLFDATRLPVLGPLLAGLSRGSVQSD